VSSNKSLGMTMPEHHVAKCSWKDCVYGDTLIGQGYCKGFGMWWHPACPCWIEDVSAEPFSDLESFMEEQLIKDSLLNLLKWVGVSSKDSANEIVNTAFIEYNALLHAISLSSELSLRDIHKLIQSSSTAELVIHLLLLKLAVLDKALAKFLFDEE